MFRLDGCSRAVLGILFVVLRVLVCQARLDLAFVDAHSAARGKEAALADAEVEVLRSGKQPGVLEAGGCG